ncbi:MAG: hypothetical protein MdMp014T_2834 [Treponematales bacterium]
MRPASLETSAAEGEGNREQGAGTREGGGSLPLAPKPSTPALRASVPVFSATPSPRGAPTKRARAGGTVTKPRSGAGSPLTGVDAVRQRGVAQTKAAVTKRGLSARPPKTPALGGYPQTPSPLCGDPLCGGTNKTRPNR